MDSYIAVVVWLGTDKRVITSNYGYTILVDAGSVIKLLVLIRKSFGWIFKFKRIGKLLVTSFEQSLLVISCSSVQGSLPTLIWAHDSLPTLVWPHCFFMYTHLGLPFIACTHLGSQFIACTHLGSPFIAYTHLGSAFIACSHLGSSFLACTYSGSWLFT